MGQLAKVVCLTRSAKGCIVMQGGQTTAVPSSNVKAIDTNGAGDMFAGAFLYAATQGYPLEKAAWLANQAAGRVVSQVGPRLDQAAMSELKALFEAHRGA